jgi:hypothetical protein
MFYAPFRPHSLFMVKKISVSEFLHSARSSFLLFPIKKENRQRLYNLLSIFILKLIFFLLTACCLSKPATIPYPCGSTQQRRNAAFSSV